MASGTAAGRPLSAGAQACGGFRRVAARASIALAGLLLALPAAVSAADPKDGRPLLLLARLAVAGGDATAPRLHPVFDPAVRHYALRCGGRDALALRLSAAQPETRLAVNTFKAHRNAEFPFSYEGRP